MEQVCDKCGKTVSGVVRVSEPQDLYSYTRDWCFACVYEKGQTDLNEQAGHCRKFVKTLR
jgi:hypothetical protein